MAALAAGLAVGCSKEDSSTVSSAGGGPTSVPADQTLQLAFVTNNVSDFWTIARAGCEKAAAELPNVKLDFELPPTGTAAEQKRIVQDLLSKGVHGIAISPKDPANQTDLLNEAASQALLICQDSDAPNSNRACYIGTDNVAAGRQAGDLLKKALPNGGKVWLFVGSVDAQNAQERKKGLEEAIAGTQITIVDTRTDETDAIKAKSNVKETILNNPDAGAFVGLWSYNGPAIVEAVKEADKVGKIQIVCFDEEDKTLQGVKDGAIYGTVVQQPYEFGYQAMKLMATVLRGDRSVIPESKKIIVPTLQIQKDNVDEFWAKLKTLRGK
jgi:ribose transport system substrate-binding protein